MDCRCTESLCKAVEVPFSKEEEDDFIFAPDSHVKAVLDRIRHHNYSLVRRVSDWKKYVNGQGPKPPEGLVRYLIPGRSSENPELACFEDVTEFFSRFPHGATPHIMELCIASRSCFTLLRNLGNLQATENLRDADGALRRLIDLIAYHGEPKMLCDEFARRISESRDAFLDARQANAMEIGQFLAAPKIGAEEGSKEEELPLSVRKDNVRRKLSSFVRGYLRAKGGTKKDAIEEVMKVLGKEYMATGLSTGYNNLRSMDSHPKFSSDPPATEDELVKAGIKL